ncbi:hypothetical protein MPSEU_000928000 [Mayamaea pseudoterrestris]|nr:hypothetical protein MPSEU_000928000 [Mayamaea pseudoterrestris]
MAAYNEDGQVVKDYHLHPSLHANPSYCLTALLLLGTFGVKLEQRTKLGKALSAPLATMAIALIAANLKLIPFASPMYDMVNSHLVGLAVPMLLMDSNQIRKLFRKKSKTSSTSDQNPNLKSLLGAFVVGTIGTLVATLIVYPLIPLRGLSASSSSVATASTPASANVGWKIACALAARHIGGAINFVAVAETLSIPGTVVSAAIAADNVVVALYFAALFALAKPASATTTSTDELKTKTSTATVVSDSELEFTIIDDEDADQDPANQQITLSSIGMALSTASGLVTLGGIITKAILPKGTSALPLTSLLTVTAATMFPKYFMKIRSAGSALGILAIQLFFAASGAAGSIALVLQQAPALFAFSALQIAVHFGILMGVGRGIFKLPLRELYLASNACVGGPTTAAAMATAKEWKALILPALWIGILGYAIATALALAMGPVLLRLPLLQ